MGEKNASFPKKALKMPGWQPCLVRGIQGKGGGGGGDEMQQRLACWFFYCPGVAF